MFKSSVTRNYNKANKYWEVDAVIDDRVRDGHVEYKLSWIGFNELHDSWEKENNLKCNDLVQIYLKEKSEKGVKNKFFVIRFFFFNT
jgi:hypothetical protein